MSESENMEENIALRGGETDKILLNLFIMIVCSPPKYLISCLTRYARSQKQFIHDGRSTTTDNALNMHFYKCPIHAQKLGGMNATGHGTYHNAGVSW